MAGLAFKSNKVIASSTEVNLSKCTLEQKIHILFSKLEFVTSKICHGKKVDESDLLISQPYPHCLINTPDDEKPNSFKNFILKKPDFSNKTESLLERLSKM